MHKPFMALSANSAPSTQHQPGEVVTRQPDQSKDWCQRQVASQTVSPVGTALEWAVPYGHGKASPPGEGMLHQWPPLGPGRHVRRPQWTDHSEQPAVEGRGDGWHHEITTLSLQRQFCSMHTRHPDRVQRAHLCPTTPALPPQLGKRAGHGCKVRPQLI